jgi:hypothetical protein
MKSKRALELEISRLELEKIRLQHDLGEAREGNSALQAQLMESNLVNNRLAQDVFRLHVRNMADPSVYRIELTMNRAGLSEALYEDSRYWCTQLAQRFYHEVYKRGMELRREDYHRMTDTAIGLVR